MTKTKICYMNKIRKFGSVLLLCTLNTFAGSAQNHTAQIQQLLAQRSILAAENQSYADLEKEIVQLGELPPALVTKTIDNGKASFDFTTYKDIRPESESRIAGRIMSTINGVESIQISNRQVAIIFTPEATETDMNDFFKLMGYTSYVIKTN